MTITLEMANPNSHHPMNRIKILNGEAVLGELHWRDWPDQQGYEFVPWQVGRRRTRVLRPDLLEALTKGAKLKAATAREAITLLTAHMNNREMPNTCLLSAWDVLAMETGVRKLLELGQIEKISAEALLSRLAKAQRVFVEYAD